MLKLITLVIQLLTALIAILLFKRYSSNFILILTTILVSSASIELWGYFDGTIYYVWYFYTLLVFVLIYILFREVLIDKKMLLCANALNLLFLLMSVIAFFQKGFFYKFLIFGSVNSSVFSFLYLRQLLMSSEILNYKKLLPFWVSVGFLIFYLPSIPFFSLLKYMQNRNLFFILKYLIILMNLFIIYGLITCNKEEKY